MRISDWSSDVCSSDLSPRREYQAPRRSLRRTIRRASRGGERKRGRLLPPAAPRPPAADRARANPCVARLWQARGRNRWKARRAALRAPPPPPCHHGASPASCRHDRSEEHTSELQSLMRISYAVFCLKKKKKN